MGYITLWVFVSLHFAGSSAHNSEALSAVYLSKSQCIRESAHFDSYDNTIISNCVKVMIYLPPEGGE